MRGDLVVAEPAGAHPAARSVGAGGDAPVLDVGAGPVVGPAAVGHHRQVAEPERGDAQARQPGSSVAHDRKGCRLVHGDRAGVPGRQCRPGGHARRLPVAAGPLVRGRPGTPSPSPRRRSSAARALPRRYRTGPAISSRQVSGAGRGPGDRRDLTAGLPRTSRRRRPARSRVRHICSRSGPVISRPATALTWSPIRTMAAEPALRSGHRPGLPCRRPPLRGDVNPARGVRRGTVPGVVGLPGRAARRGEGPQVATAEAVGGQVLGVHRSRTRLPGREMRRSRERPPANASCRTGGRPEDVGPRRDQA